MEDYFSNYHPIVILIYFIGVIMFGMLFMHPICLVIGLMTSLGYSFCLNGRKALKFNLKYMLPMCLVAVVINPLFNHEGMTILGYFKSGNPLTLESIEYGIAAAAMILVVVTWCGVYNIVFSSEKFIYIFGRIIPAFSLILSMILRFIPLFNKRIKVIVQAQEGILEDKEKKNLLKKIKLGIRILSIMVTWSMESAIDVADSMKSRGYGLSGRTAFSNYYWEKKDKYILIYMLVLGTYIVIGMIKGQFAFYYFPKMSSFEIDKLTVSFYISYAAFCLIPLGVNGIVEKRIKKIESQARSSDNEKDLYN